MTRNYIAGTNKRAHANTNAEYEYFLPNKLPELVNFQDDSIPKLLEDANQHLGELNAFARFAPDIDYFISMHETKEASQSSSIEGTQTSVDEAVMKIEEIQPERRNDWQEVQNYLKAMRFAIKRLEDIPLATRFLKEVHYELLQGVRGEKKTPGELRWSQNWIGGSTLKDAKFIPPAAEHLNELLKDFDNYLNNHSSKTPHLIKIALLHYQFETIHPFLDGNGRLGRLMIVLYLIENKKLTKPILYLSDYFAKYKSVYYGALEEVRRNNDITHWIKFFLVAVSETSKHSCSTLEQIIELKTSNTEKVSGLGKRSLNAIKLLNKMYSEPIVTSNDVVEMINVTLPTANSLIKSLVNLGILKETTGFARNRVFEYRAYIDLFRAQ